MILPRLLMEDHCDAYPLWKEHGLHGRACVHVDAHLDVATDGFTPDSLGRIAACRTRADLEVFRGSEYLPWGGFHCGNYLYPALLEGMVEHLVWVLPPDLPGGDLLTWIRGELQNWLEITTAEYRALRLEDGRVEGTLCGRRLSVCTADRLPPLPDGVLLDVDVDYFLDADDRVWQTPDELRRQLGPLKVAALTVAFSVNGGYTPLEHRYLGDAAFALLGEGDSRWNAVVEALLEEDRLREGGQADYSRVLSGLAEPPSWLRAAVAVKTAISAGEPPGGPGWREAERLDPGWRFQAINQGATLFRRREYAQAEAWLDRAAREAPEEEPLCRYMQGLAEARRGDADAAVARWLPLLDHPRLAPGERAFVAFARGKVLTSMGRPAEGTEALERAVATEPDHPVYLHHLGLARKAAGSLEEAATALRRSLRLAPDRLGAAEGRLALAEIYEALGRPGLAQAERRQVARTDPTGLFALKSLLRGNP